MKVIHKSPLQLSQNEVILQECSWGGFTKTLLSCIPKESKEVGFWDTCLKEHHNTDVLFENEYTLLNFPFSYVDLVWIGKNLYGVPTENTPFCIELMQDSGINVSLCNSEVVELRLLDRRYL